MPRKRTNPSAIKQSSSRKKSNKSRMKVTKQRHEQFVAKKDPMPGNLSLSDTQEDLIQEMDYLSQKPSDNTTGLPSGQQENENEQNKNWQIPDVNIELILPQKRTRNTNRVPIIGRSNDDNLFEDSDAN
ncbi:14109_t:CDS:2, partial [Funneliformis caledonium]